MRFGNNVTDRSNPHAPLEYWTFVNKRAQATLTDAVEFRDGALTLRTLGDSARDREMRGGMMYNDGSVLMHSLNHPACEGMILECCTPQRPPR